MTVCESLLLWAEKSFVSGEPDCADAAEGLVARGCGGWGCVCIAAIDVADGGLLRLLLTDVLGVGRVNTCPATGCVSTVGAGARAVSGDLVGEDASS